MTKVVTALISASDKTMLPQFAKRLTALGVDILSTGGTARLLRENGVPVLDVSDYTGFPEILDGRVKTLHPKVHAGLLALRDKAEHRKQIDQYGVRLIDMVVVNLYPFESTISRPGVELMDAIENIDIGGPTMIRSAAKNYSHVAVITRPADYDAVANELEQNGCCLSQETHFELALKAFQHTAHYDRAIAEYLGALSEQPPAYPDLLTLEFKKRQDLRYGENPYQSAAFYVEAGVREPSVARAEQLAGTELSYNNILDIDGALELVKEFDRPAAAVIKHTNPCGAATADTLSQAYENAYRGDPVSAFGSIVALNRPLDTATAGLIAELRAETGTGPAPYFVEAIVAPNFEEGALKVLYEKTNWGTRTRILKTGELHPGLINCQARDLRRVVGGLLVQSRDLAGLDPDSLKVVTEAEPTEEQMADLKFGWICCKHVKSNAIVLAARESLVGVGAGQMNRLDSTIIAIRKAGERAAGSVMASDAFFPFPDALQKAAEAGVGAIIQPGGSKQDGTVIKAANRHGIAMVFTGMRHFRH